MMAERGVGVSRATILRRVQRYVPEFEKRWQRYAQPVGSSWRVDETYIRVKGRWTYLIVLSISKDAQSIICCASTAILQRRKTVLHKRG